MTKPRDGLCEPGGHLPKGLGPTQPPVGSSERPCLACCGGATHRECTSPSAPQPSEGPLCGKNCFHKTELWVLPCGRSYFPGVIL